MKDDIPLSCADEGLETWDLETTRGHTASPQESQGPTSLLQLVLPAPAQTEAKLYSPPKGEFTLSLYSNISRTSPFCLLLVLFFYIKLSDQ